MKYFCDTCGERFESDRPFIELSCPNCGCYDIYEDTPEGSLENVRSLNAYEAELILWED